MWQSFGWAFAVLLAINAAAVLLILLGSTIQERRDKERERKFLDAD